MTDSKLVVVCVLEKLRELRNRGFLKGAIWDFGLPIEGLDDVYSYDEYLAIKLLSDAGVIQHAVMTVQDIPPVPTDAPKSKHNKDLFNASFLVRITDYDDTKYKEACRDYGLDPISEDYQATITLEDDITPVVVIDDKHEYRFIPMRSGTPLYITQYCFANPGMKITLSELRDKQYTGGVNSISDSIRSSLFGRNKVLSVFTEARPTTMKIKSPTQLSPDDVRAIRLAANSYRFIPYST